MVENTLHNVLYIDLSKKRYRIEKRPDLFEKYIGGTGVATALLLEECPQGIAADSPDNPIIFAVGPLTGLFPLASKTVAMFKSPHTGNLGESHAGGRSAIAIRSAGYGAVVIKGKSDIPVYIAIHGHKIHFRNASTLWGMKSCFVAGSVIRENEPGAGVRAIMRIGKGGENGVTFSCVTTETYRHFGRLGLGTVFGSKNMKAIIVSGSNTIPVVDKKKYKVLYDQIYSTAVNSQLMKKYHDLGTAGNVLSLDKMGALPTRNLQSGSFEHSEIISGEYLAEHYLGRRLACSHCPVACVHIAALREAYVDEPYFYSTTMIGYDFELIYALGTTLGISNPEGMLQLIDAVEEYAIDTMSTGVVLAWATEAFQKGIISTKETDGLTPSWGDYKTYIEMVDKLIEPPNDFFKALGRGADHVSKIYGGSEYALSFGGNEMPGYHTGPAGYLGYLLGTRHSHLDNAGYSIDQKTLVSEKKIELTPEKIVDEIIKEEKWRQILSGLVICFFARGIYDEEVVRSALMVAGNEKSSEEIGKIASEIYAMKYAFKAREGFSFDGLHIPDRIFETKSPTGSFDRAFMEKAIKYAKDKIEKMINPQT